MMKLKNINGDVVYEGGEIRYDEPLRGWVTDVGVFSDPDKLLVLAGGTLKISPIEFKLLFTVQERIAIKTARQTDAVIDDFYSIVEDPRLTFVDLGLASTQQAVGYLATQNLIEASRVDEILAGEFQ